MLQFPATRRSFLICSKEKVLLMFPTRFGWSVAQLINWFQTCQIHLQLTLFWGVPWNISFIIFIPALLKIVSLVFPFAWKVSMYIVPCCFFASNRPHAEFPARSDRFTFIVWQVSNEGAAGDSWVPVSRVFSPLPLSHPPPPQPSPPPVQNKSLNAA